MQEALEGGEKKIHEENMNYGSSLNFKFSVKLILSSVSLTESQLKLFLPVNHLQRVFISLFPQAWLISPAQ